MATRMGDLRSTDRAEKNSLKADLLIEGWKEAGCLSSVPAGDLPDSPARRHLRPFLCQRRLSGSFGDFAGTDACRADAKGFPGAVHDGVYTLEIGVPPSPGDVVSMTHVISVCRAFAANFASTRHQKLLWKWTIS